MISTVLEKWWHLIAIAIIAFLVLAATVLPASISLAVPIIVFGPFAGIALDEYRGGTGIAGGCIAGLISGLAVSTIGFICFHYIDRPNVWYDSAWLFARFTIPVTVLGLHWGHVSRSWRWSTAGGTAANAKENGR